MDQHAFLVQTPVAKRHLEALPWISYWTIMAISFGAGFWWLHGRPIDPMTGAILSVGNMLLVAVCEFLIPGVPGVNLFRDRQSWNDIGHLIVDNHAAKPVAWWVTLGLVGFTGSHWRSSVGAWPTNLPQPLQLFLLLLSFNFLGYWIHRAFHSFDLLFRFHAIHHDTERIHMLKAGRIHFGEELINFVAQVSPFLLVQAPQTMLIWLGTWNVFEGNLAHSNVAQRFPWWFHFIGLTSQEHTLHHSTNPELQNRNFSALPIWDVIFGTFTHPDGKKVTSTGLRRNPIPPAFVRQLMFPFSRVSDL